MKFEIKNRWTGNVQGECELSSEFAGKSYGLQLGAAVKIEHNSGADLHGAVLRGADLRGADLSDADLSDVPKIPNIHQAIYQAASKNGALDMGNWHSCATTHCRAGWIVHLAGAAGKAMEWCLGTPAAAALIYVASDSELEKVPDFFASNEEALADMKHLAELEMAKEAMV